jgi:hypothetical protein
MDNTDRDSPDGKAQQCGPWGCCGHLSEREADTTAVTFEFDYLLDPIGPDQAPGASRFAPADAMTPTPGGSRGYPDAAPTTVEADADAWLIELLAEGAPSAAPTTDEDMTWLDEPAAAAAGAPSALPMPVLETLVDLPPPAALTALTAGKTADPSDVLRAQDVLGSRFATSRTDDDRLPIRRRRLRRSH